MGVTVFECIMIVNAYDRSCECCDLTEGDKDSLVNLSLRGEQRADKE